MADSLRHADNDFPVLDLGLSGTADGHRQLVQDFLHTYSSIGFSAVVNHGIPADLMNGVFDASRRFHAQSLAEKNKISLDSNHRGYIAIDTSTDVNSQLDNVTLPNQSESFMLMREDAADSHAVRSGAFLAGANQWPALDNFKKPVNDYLDAATQLAQRLISITAEALGCADSQLSTLFSPPTLWLRLLHYPPRPNNAPDNLYGSAPHTDFGALTLLLQDDIGGLQVKHPQGHWLDVPCIPGALVVNVGDMLHRLSNGRLRSTPHRVINRSGLERYSCAFFYDPYVDSTITPLPQCTDNQTPARLEPLNFGEFLRNELSASYQQHQQS
ncbi:MAG: 2OG-Fe(II) oxygenase family protein [Pseudomonadota bacterium]